MIANGYLKYLVRKENAFIQLFENNSKNLLKAALLLNELLNCAETGDYERIYREIKDLEHTGDEITRKTYEQLYKSFITPFDRKDIHELTAHIDDVVDLIDGISRHILLYKPKKIIPVFGKLSDLIYKAAVEIKNAIHLLKDPASNKLKIMISCQRIKLLEHNADEIYFSGAHELFSSESDTKELIKLSKILETLEKCINEEENISNTIKTIIIKMV
jgi:uncharacterized protein